MKLAVERTKNSFTERWEDFCKKNGIDCKLVNTTDNDIIDQLEDCDALLWHWHQGDPKRILFARQLTYSLEQAGKAVFPDSRTVWHFDDKVGQKYLLEALHIKSIPTYIFYDRKQALEWAKTTSFPKVFKLRGGAGSNNVRLVKNAGEASRLINKMFSCGVLPFDNWSYLLDSWRKFCNHRGTFRSVLSALRRLLEGSEYTRMAPREKGYVYFQDFLENNNYDIRVVVIGDRAFALRRMCRKKDFRASGSGLICYDRDLLDKECIAAGFEAARLLNGQCLAMDFVYDADHQPLLIEISYGFAMRAYDACPGYYTADMVWHEEQFNPQYWMIEDLINNLKHK